MYCGDYFISILDEVIPGYSMWHFGILTVKGAIYMSDITIQHL